MSELVVTVHKPQQPPIPEPEGWIILEYCSGGWWVDSGYLVKPSERESLEDAVSTIKNTPIRLVHIGHAPKVPVEAIAWVTREIELVANNERAEHPQASADTDVITQRIRSWLAEQEEGDK